MVKISKNKGDVLLEIKAPFYEYCVHFLICTGLYLGTSILITYDFERNSRTPNWYVSLCNFVLSVVDCNVRGNETQNIPLCTISEVGLNLERSFTKTSKRQPLPLFVESYPIKIIFNYSYRSSFLLNILLSCCNQFKTMDLI